MECPSSGVEAPIGWADDPEGWVSCLVLGLLLSSLALVARLPITARVAAFISGQVIGLTAPVFAHLDTYVIGRFPTTDKYGSLAFYLDGVHQRLLLDPLGSLQDPAARLIGVHMGHLWVTEFFDLWMTPEGAMNLQGFVYPVLAWGCASLLFRSAGAHLGWSVLMAFPFGMGLHLFRDLNCYTVEKSAVFWLPLFLWSLLRAHREGGVWTALSGILYLLMTWMNLYMGMVGAALGALIGTPILLAWLRGWLQGHFRPPSLVVAFACCAFFSFPLALWQLALSSGPDALGGPDIFQSRAALDSLELWPFEWNRLPWWGALSPLAIGLIIFGIPRVRDLPLVRSSAVAIIGLTALALGPAVGDLTNPVDAAARSWIPGFWRTAKPEVFFQGAWLLLLGTGALGMSRRPTSRALLGALYLAMATSWLLLVRSHAEYPSMSEKTAVHLASDWESRVFGPSTPATK